MKFLTVMLLAAIPFGAFSQKKTELSWPSMNLDPTTNLITYTAVPEVPNVSATDMYDRAMSWAATYYKNHTEKLRKTNRATGELEIFGRFAFFAYDKKGVKTTGRQGLAQYTMTVRFRDGRYKYTITKLNLKASSYQPLEAWLDRDDSNARNHSFYLTDVDAELRNVIKSMSAAIAKAPNAPTDDW